MMLLQNSAVMGDRDGNKTILLCAIVLLHKKKQLLKLKATLEGTFEGWSLKGRQHTHTHTTWHHHKRNHHYEYWQQ